jgi:hypothetical protein
MMRGSRVGPQRDPGGLLDLTQDEAAVIRAIRRTPYGEVIAKTKKGAIVNIDRHETIKPPSLSAQARLLREDPP